MKLKLLAISMLLLCFTAIQAQTADEILSKYFANTGGLDKWKALKSRTIKGKVFFGQDFPMTTYEMTPNKQRREVDVMGSMIIQAFDGTTGWMVNPMQGGKDPVKLDDEQAKEMKNEQFENDFIDYKKKGHEVTLEGTEDVDGIKCYKIKLVRNKNNDQDDAIELHYFDVENFIPLVITRTVQAGPQKGTEVKSYLSDYQEVNGLMFPFLTEQKVNGQTAAKVTVEKITINDIKDESIFAFPKK
ncbi:MAG TPA: hypothetical protein PLR06_10195 [Cyclobacteriaceae bacterium]|nr:hypothetical protein [Cyclobacteriaceae bacterium]